MIGVGTQILINADEIDKINGSFQSGLESTMVADTIRGMTGFSRSQNGQPSYLDRMTAEASSGVRSSAVNAALSILAAARQVETIYKTAKEGSRLRLRMPSRSCATPRRPAGSSSSQKVQERAAGASLRIATTTEFSQKDNRRADPAACHRHDPRPARLGQSLALINQLISSVTNTSSAAAQRAALERLDSMVANNQLHSSSEAQNAQKQKDEVTAAIGTLVEETLKEWGDSQDAEIGWCNVNNPAVIDRWFNAWKI